MTQLFFSTIHRPGDSCLQDHTLNIDDGRDKLIRVNFGSDLMIFPGLINCHTHLDFDLFPTLAQQPHEDWLDWGNWLHRTHSSLINEIMNVPIKIRTLWGAYRQLLCGVTQVVNHGRATLSETSKVIGSIDSDLMFDSIHSRLLRTQMLFRRKRFHIHLCEGTGLKARQEWDELKRMNLFGREVCAVHGLKIPSLLEPWLTAIVWCPVSNHNLYLSSLDRDMFEPTPHIFFGTDSTLSAEGDFFKQLRFARTQQDNDQELFESITQKPVNYWGGQARDWVIALGGSRWDCFFELTPADILLVVRSGEAVLVDDEAKEWVTYCPKHKIEIGGRTKHLNNDLDGIIKAIKEKAPNSKLNSLTGW